MHTTTSTSKNMTPVRRLATWGSAVSVDGVWGYSRAEDTGTWWYVVHQPTNWMIPTTFATLDHAREFTAGPDAIGRFRADAERALTHLTPDRRSEQAERHRARARALLAWIAQHHPEVPEQRE